MQMTLVSLQIKNQVAGSRPTDDKVRAPAIAKSSVPRLFPWVELNGSLQDGVKAGQYHFESPQEHDDPSQVNFFLCGNVVKNLAEVFQPLVEPLLAQEFGSLLRETIEASSDEIDEYFEAETAACLELE